MNKNQGKTLWDRTDKRGVFETRQRARASLPARSEGMSVQAATRTMCEHLEAGPSQDAEG